MRCSHRAGPCTRPTTPETASSSCSRSPITTSHSKPISAPTTRSERWRDDISINPRMGSISMISEMHNMELKPEARTFWELADATRVQMEYVADRRLKWMQTAPLASVQRVLAQYRFFTIYYISDLALLVHRLPFSKLRSLL